MNAERINFCRALLRETQEHSQLRFKNLLDLAFAEHRHRRTAYARKPIRTLPGLGFALIGAPLMLRTIQTNDVYVFEAFMVWILAFTVKELWSCKGLAAAIRESYTQLREAIRIVRNVRREQAAAAAESKEVFAKANSFTLESDGDCYILRFNTGFELKIMDTEETRRIITTEPYVNSSVSAAFDQRTSDPFIERNGMRRIRSSLIA